MRDVVWRENLGGEHLELGERSSGAGLGKLRREVGTAEEAAFDGAACLQPGWPLLRQRVG